MVLKIIIVLLSLLNAGFMAFDGGRALIVGDYIRPKGGDYAGQLGPWSKIVSAIGIDPMSTLMKCIFLLVGIYGVIAALCFAFNVAAGWKMLLAFCILAIWNLMFGTMSCVLVILFLVMWKWKFTV